MKRYRIAGHIVAVEGDGEIEELMWNYAPFACDGDDNSSLVLTVNFEDDAAWPQDVTEVGHFDVNGSPHGVCRTGDGGYLLDVCDTSGYLCCRMLTDRLFTRCHVCMRPGTEQQRRFGINNCLMIGYAFATMDMDTILFHASVIGCDGRGYLVTAPSGTGKSTHTYLWHKVYPECELINDDNPVVRILPDGRAMVYGSPWSGKTRCYRNVEFPIGAFVHIKRSKENRIYRPEPLDAFVMLLPACSNMKWDARIYNRISDSVTKFVQVCDVWELECLPNNEAAILCHDTVCKKSGI